MNGQAREARVRRTLARLGIALRKDRARSADGNHRGGYMLIDAVHDRVLGGEHFELTLEDCEGWVAEAEAML